MKKRRVIYGLSSLLLLGGLVGVVSCQPEPTPEPTPDPKPDPDKKPGVESFTVELSGSNSISIGETVNIVATSNTDGYEGIFGFTVIEGENFIDVNDNGTVTGIAAGTAKVQVECFNMSSDFADSSTQTVDITVTGEATQAVGAANFVGKTYEEKLDILGKLEKYAIDNHLTGITLFENGGYVMYSSRIQKPTNNYITGYGLGVLSEGSITAPMESESNPNWQMYYHTFGGANNKQNFNYLDDTGSESVSLFGYISSTYYGQKMNASKNGYDWYPVLALENPETGDFKPQALNTNPATGLATKYKVYVRSGEKGGVKYSTLSTKEGRAAYNDRYVELEDYRTPFMLLLNGKIGLARNADYISDSSNSTLRGARAFSDMTKNASNGGDVKTYIPQFEKLVGMELNKEESSITFTFNTPVNQFTAMTNLSSTLNSPIPLDFIELLGKECKDTNPSTMYGKAMKDAYGTRNAIDKNFTPVDNILSVAPYTLEEVNDTAVVYKRNPSWFEFSSSDPTIKNRYSIEGIKIVYDQAAASDTTAAFQSFLDGTLDSASIPKEYMAEYVNNPLTTTTQGDATFKLNLNTATQKEWDKLFEDTKAQFNWECEPLMSNDNFVNALSFAIDRKTYAQTRGSVASQSYFAPAYLWEPEKGLSYNDTAQHKAAIAEYSPDTNGYNFDLAVQLFDRAISEEIFKGSYSSYNTTVDIDIFWMNTTDTKEYGNELVSYFNKAFEATNAYASGFRINFNNHDGTTNYQDVYDKMKRGQFDMGFGSISGMQLDPLGFMEVLKSDNSSGFTLNWGIDTSSIVEDSIYYDGREWSFDGLWTAATKGAIIENDAGVNRQPVKLNRNTTSSNIISENVQVGSAQVEAWRIAYEFSTEVATSGVSFKAFADAQARNEEYVTVTISYTMPGSSAVTQSVAFNATLDGLFKIPGNQVTEDGTFNAGSGANKRAGFYIYIPKVLNETSTDKQVVTPVDLSQATTLTVSIYATYYMTIENIPVATTLTNSGFVIK